LYFSCRVAGKSYQKLPAMARINLPNGCSYTEPIISPANWDLRDAKLTKDWYIKYRFFDPSVTTGTYAYPVGRQIVLKRMNKYKHLTARRDATKALLKNEIDLLENQDYNPIKNTKKVVQAVNHSSKPIPVANPDDDEALEGEIDPSTPFDKALDEAFKLLTCSEGTKHDVGHALTHIQPAVKQLRYDQLPVCTIQKRHVKRILARIGKNKGDWSASNFNHYRSYMMMLFNALSDAEATDIDPVTKIKKIKEVRRIKLVLTQKERNRVHYFLKTRHYRFWRFVQIFFHSGARISEILRVKREDVDIENQRFKALIKKGKQYVEVWKIIKDIALPYWLVQLENAQKGDYLFSYDLKPGRHLNKEVQITRRWKYHIKGKLGILADLYSLKHLHTTEVMDILTRDYTQDYTPEEDAAKINSHTSTSMVKKVYDIKHKTRQEDRIKKIWNPFGEDATEKTVFSYLARYVKNQDGSPVLTNTDPEWLYSDTIDHFGVRSQKSNSTIEGEIQKWTVGFIQLTQDEVLKQKKVILMQQSENHTQVGS
jgi:integrase